MKKVGGFLKNRFPPEAYVFAGLVVVSLFTLIVSTQHLLNIQTAGVSAFSGVRGMVHEASSFVSDTVLAVQELARLREEHAELLERIARYERLERTAAEISQENVRLREQLGFSQEFTFRHIPARIVGRDPDNLFSAIVINKGTRAGVTRDMPVIAWQGGTQALVGKVIQARAFESLVMPVFDSNLFVSARLATSRFEGIVEGQGNPNMDLVMRFISKRARDEITRGELIVSSGMGGVYPPDINIGRVSRILYSDHDISMEVELEPLIDFSRLEYVFVIETQDTRLMQMEVASPDSEYGEDAISEGSVPSGEGAVAAAAAGGM